MKKTVRNSNIEIIRIMSMMLIVLGHFAWQTNWNFSETNIFLKSGIQFLWFGGKLGVNLFVLITAFFLANKTEVNFNSLKKLWKQTLYYSITLTVIGVVLFHLPISLKFCMQAVLPVLTGAYWFVTAYVVMILIAPFINRSLVELNEHDFQRLLIILFGIFIATSIFHTEAIGFNVDEAATIIAIYPFGVYVRRFKADFIRIRTRYYWCGIVLSLLGMYSSVFGINLVHAVEPSVLNGAQAYGRFFGSTSPFQVVLAMSIFALFLKLPECHNLTVNKIASGVFGVYLLHCHPMLINFIWLHVVNAQRFSNSSFVFIYAIIVVVSIFCIGIVYDFIRQYFFIGIKWMFVIFKRQLH